VRPSCVVLHPPLFEDDLRDVDCLKSVGTKNQAGQGLSERRASRLVGMARTSCRYERQRPGEEAKLQARLRSLAGERRRFGYRRLTVLLRREGWAVNHKRVYRLRPVSHS